MHTSWLLTRERKRWMAWMGSFGELPLTQGVCFKGKESTEVWIRTTMGMGVHRGEKGI